MFKITQLSSSIISLSVENLTVKSEFTVDLQLVSVNGIQKYYACNMLKVKMYFALDKEK